MAQSHSHEIPSRSKLRERAAEMRDEPEKVGDYSLQEVKNSLWMNLNSEFRDDHGLQKQDKVAVYRDRDLGCLFVFPKSGGVMDE